jgi:hypothetical protein
MRTRLDGINSILTDTTLCGIGANNAIWSSVFEAQAPETCHRRAKMDTMKHYQRNLEIPKKLMDSSK